MQTQITDYRTLTSNVSSSSALYSVWAGGNDILNYMHVNNPSDDPTDIANLVNQTVGNIGTAIQNIYDDGGRHFLVPNLPALGNKPDFVNTDKQSLANQIITLFNQALQDHLSQLSLALLEIELFYFDVYAITDAIFNDPESYGLNNITDSAYDGSGAYPGTVVTNPEEYLFWDATHPTTGVHTLIGNIAYNTLVPEPATVAVLLAGMMATMAILQRRRR